ncbi:MAG: methylglyoxal synthase [Clostridia bacterium]|nr:methylglyoxal synthase [Clostridia bacterium]
MNIALIADDNKKELMAQFCIAYCGILCRHTLCATYATGNYVSDATGLEIESYLSGEAGGTEQIASRVSFNEIDLVFYFRGTDSEKSASEAELALLRLCDIHNIPLATNIATAEVLVTALDAGSLDWRELVNPRSDYNLKKKKK